jgi:hypothetical protein
VPGVAIHASSSAVDWTAEAGVSVRKAAEAARSPLDAVGIVERRREFGRDLDEPGVKAHRLVPAMVMLSACSKGR